MLSELLVLSGYVYLLHANSTGAQWLTSQQYVRYIDWVITTPLLLLELLLATGLSGSDIFTTVFLDLVMIIAGLVGALVASTYKWGFFVGGTFALFYVWFVSILLCAIVRFIYGTIQGTNS